MCFIESLIRTTIIALPSSCVTQLTTQCIYSTADRWRSVF